MWRIHSSLLTFAVRDDLPTMAVNYRRLIHRPAPSGPSTVPAASKTDRSDDYNTLAEGLCEVATVR